MTLAQLDKGNPGPKAFCWGSDTFLGWEDSKGMNGNRKPEAVFAPLSAYSRAGRAPAELLNGGRAGTRTPDLLRVKPDPGFFRLHNFHRILCLFNRLGSLLFAQSASSTGLIDGVLIRF